MKVIAKTTTAYFKHYSPFTRGGAWYWTKPSRRKFMKSVKKRTPAVIMFIAVLLTANSLFTRPSDIPVLRQAEAHEEVKDEPPSPCEMDGKGCKDAYEEYEKQQQPTPTPERVVQEPVKQPVYGDWDGLLQQHFGASWATAKQIMHCESGGNTMAVGDTNTAYSSHGLFQVRTIPGRPSAEWLHVPENNVSYAAGLYRANGWTPWWNCSKKLGLL